MVTLVRQLTMVIVTALSIYTIFAYVLHHTLTKKIKPTLFSITSEFIKSSVVFLAGMFLSWWILDLKNIKSILPISSHIGRATLAEILVLPLSTSLWAICSASLILVLIKKLIFIWLHRPIPNIISFAIAVSSGLTGFYALYIGLTETKKHIAQFADMVQTYSFYLNTALSILAALLLVIAIIFPRAKRAR